MTATLVDTTIGTPRPLPRLLALLGCGQFGDAVIAMTVMTHLLGGEHGVDGGRVLGSILIASLPHIVATPLGAGMVDWWDRTRTITAAQAVRAVAATLAVIAVAVDLEPLAWLAAAVLLATARFVHTWRSAVLPHVARADSLVPAGAVTLLVGLACGGAGAFVGVAARDRPALVVAVAVASHVLGGWGFASWSLDLGGRAGRPRRVGDRSDTIRRLAGHGSLLVRRDVTLTSAHRFLLGATFATLVTWITATRDAASGYVAVAGVTSTATVLGIASAPIAVSALGRRGVAFGATVGSASVLLLAAHLDLGVAGLPLVAAAFFFFQHVRGSTEASLQAGIADAVRGRVLALYDVLYNLAYLAGAASIVAVGLAPLTERAMLALGAAYAFGATGLVLAGACRPRRPLA